MAKIIVGYKAKKDIRKGLLVNSDKGFFEPIYEEQNPIDELADLAHRYAHVQNDPDSSKHIDQLVAIIKGEAHPPTLERNI